MWVPHWVLHFNSDSHADSCKGRCADNYLSSLQRCFFLSFFCFIPALLDLLLSETLGLKLNAFQLLYANHISEVQRCSTKPVTTLKMFFSLCCWKPGIYLQRNVPCTRPAQICKPHLASHKHDGWAFLQLLLKNTAYRETNLEMCNVTFHPSFSFTLNILLSVTDQEFLLKVKKNDSCVLWKC
jgi:hypothetical protein